MLAGTLTQERTVEELRDRAIKARLIAKSTVNPFLWAVTTIFFVVVTYGLWQTTYPSFTISYMTAFIFMIFAVWLGKMFVSVTFLKWYIAFQGKQFQKEMFNKLYLFHLRKYGDSEREATKWANDTMKYDVNSILEFLEREDR